MIGGVRVWFVMTWLWVLPDAFRPIAFATRDHGVDVLPATEARHASASQQQKSDSPAASADSQSLRSDSAAQKRDSATKQSAAPKQDSTQRKQATPSTAAATVPPNTINPILLGILIGLFSIPFGLAIGRCIAAIAKEDGARIESHWGGFGGGLGGWRLSPALMYFLVAIFIAGLFTTTVYLLKPGATAAQGTQSPPPAQSPPQTSKG